MATETRSARSQSILAIAAFGCLWSSAVRAQPLSAGAAETGAAEIEGSDTADPPVAVQAEYRDVVAHAVAEFDAGRWVEARALFLRAHELWPSARTYRTLGMASFELRHYAEALRALDAALADTRRPLTGELLAQTEVLRKRAAAFVGRYRLQLTPAEVVVTVDGALASREADGSLLLDAGERILRASAAGHRTDERRLDVRGGTDQKLSIELDSEVQEATTPRSAAISTAITPARAVPEQAIATTLPAKDDDGIWSSPWLWTGVGVLVAGGIVGTAVLLTESGAQTERLYEGNARSLLGP